MHPQLQRIVDDFEDARTRLHDLADRLPRERWARRADAERWSVAECVAHLNLTSRAYLPPMRNALEKARELGEGYHGRYRRDPMGWLLSFATGPLPRFGRRRLGAVRTTAEFEPEGPLPRDEVMVEFDRLQEEQIEVARGSEGLAIHRVRIASPFDPRLRYSLYSALRILPRHQARHTEQARRVWAG